MNFKSFPQRIGTMSVAPTQITLAFSAGDLLGLEEQINGYVSRMLVEIVAITMTFDTKATGANIFNALVVFKDQERS